MKKGTKIFLSFFILFSIPCFFVHGQSMTNPIFRNSFTADPAPMVYNGRLYVYVGKDEANTDDQFTMTAWLCYSTADMKSWTYHGPMMKPTDFKWASKDAWASQVVEKDGKFFLYVTVVGNNPYGGRNIGVAVSDSPTGPFVDAKGVPLVRDNMTNNGKTWDDMDPTVLIDDDGTAYLTWGNPLCYFAKLKPNMIELDGAIKIITPPNYAEGPWLHKRNGMYYLTYPAFIPGVGSEQMCYSTATNINGPWTYRGILTGTAKSSFTIHPGIVEFLGQWYLFYHNATLTLNGQGPALGRRSVCVEYLCYNADGTMKPVIQTTAGISIASPCPPVAVTQTPYSGIPHNIPGRIEAEDYDLGGEGVAFHEANTNGNQGEAGVRDDQVDIETTSDVDGALNISYILSGEYLEYTVNITEAAAYNLSLRVASNEGSKTMHVELDEKNISGSIIIPSTGGWQTWQTVRLNNISLPAGKHTLRIAFDSDYFNFNYLQFQKSDITGIEETTPDFWEEGKFAFPNPFENTFRIELAGEFTYKILDITGQELENGVSQKATDLGKYLPNGVYILEVRYLNKNKKLIMLKR